MASVGYWAPFFFSVNTPRVPVRYSNILKLQLLIALEQLTIATTVATVHCWNISLLQQKWNFALYSVSQKFFYPLEVSYFFQNG